MENDKNDNARKLNDDTKDVQKLDLGPFPRFWNVKDKTLLVFWISEMKLDDFYYAGFTSSIAVTLCVQQET